MPDVESVKPEPANDLLNVETGVFGAALCRRVDFRYIVAKDKFDHSRFAEFFGAETIEDTSLTGVTCRTLDPILLDYHIHFRWRVSREEITLYITFHRGVVEQSENERQPYAETFIAWLGGFFENQTAHGDEHALFDYPVTDRVSRFPLPLKLNISEDLAAEIRGIDVSFDSASGGITGAGIRHIQKRLVIELSGTIDTTFSIFRIQEEVSRLGSFALRMTERRESK